MPNKLSSEQKAELSGALARAYCYQENSKKQMDSELLKAMGKELEQFLAHEIDLAVKSERDRVNKWAENTFRLVEPAMLVPIIDDNGQEIGRKIDRFKGSWINYEELLEALKDKTND